MLVAGATSWVDVALAAFNVVQVVALAAIAAWSRKSARSLNDLNGHASRTGTDAGRSGTPAPRRRDDDRGVDWRHVRRD